MTPNGLERRTVYVGECEFVRFFTFKIIAEYNVIQRFLKSPTEWVERYSFFEFRAPSLIIREYKVSVIWQQITIKVTMNKLKVRFGLPVTMKYRQAFCFSKYG
jgi:hypothetical protein